MLYNVLLPHVWTLLKSYFQNIYSFVWFQTSFRKILVFENEKKSAIFVVSQFFPFLTPIKSKKKTL